MKEWNVTLRINPQRSENCGHVVHHVVEMSVEAPSEQAAIAEAFIELGDKGYTHVALVSCKEETP